MSRMNLSPFYNARYLAIKAERDANPLLSRAKDLQAMEEAADVRANLDELIAEHDRAERDEVAQVLAGRRRKAVPA